MITFWLHMGGGINPYLESALIKRSASGSVASFSDGADRLPLRTLKVNIKPVQTGSGDPSPTNERPITGWTGADISQSSDINTDPSVISILFPAAAGTVYEGTLTINPDGSIDLVNMWGSFEFDGSDDEDWKVSSNIRYYVKKSNLYYVRTSSAYIKCDKLKSIAASALGSSTENCCYIGSSPEIGIAKASIPNSISNFRAFLAENPVHIIAKLRTNNSYHFDSLEKFFTLLGENNIWANCGNVSVDYFADATLAYEELRNQS